MPFTWSYGQLWQTMRKQPILLRLSGAQLLWVRFRTDPRVVRELLPHPLKVPNDPLATVFVADYVQTNFGPPYQEAVLSVDAAFRGQIGNYMAAVLLTDDMAIAGGRAGGYPNKLADVDLTIHDDHAVGWATRRGVDVLRLEGAILEETGRASALGLPIEGLAGEPALSGVNWLFKTALGEGIHAYKWRPVLTRQSVLFSPRPGQRRAQLELKLISTPTDPLGDIPIVEIAAAGFGAFDIALLPARTVHRVRNPWDLYRKTTFASDWFADMDFDALPSHGIRDQIRLWRKANSY